MFEPENMAISQLGLGISCVRDYNEPTLTVIPLFLLFLSYLLEKFVVQVYLEVQSQIMPYAIL